MQHFVSSDSDRAFGKGSILARLAGPRRHSAWSSTATILAVVLIIAWFDYVTASRVSLVLLYMVPISLAVAWLGRLAASAVASLCVGLRVAGDIANGVAEYPLAATWNRLTDLLVYLVLVWVLDGLITLFRDLDRLVADRTNALQKAITTRQQLERELAEAGARERSVMGRELHDDLCQQLVGTALAAKVLAENLSAAGIPAARDAQSIVSYMEESVAKTRAMARGLLLSAIEPRDLANELAGLAAQTTAEGVACHFMVDGAPVAASPAVAAQLFRIAQEAVRNALRHAHATRIDIVFAGTDESTVLMVTDNGGGLPAAGDRRDGMGLRIMEHRAGLIGAALTIVPAPGSGTRVICHLPLVPAGTET